MFTAWLISIFVLVKIAVELKKESETGLEMDEFTTIVSFEAVKLMLLYELFEVI